MMAQAGASNSGDQLEGGVGVVEVVVAQLLALDLLGGGDARPWRAACAARATCAACIKRRLLVRVLAVAELLAQHRGNGHAPGEGLAQLAAEPAADGGVIGGGARVGLGGQPLAQLCRGGAAVGLHVLDHRAVVGGLYHHGDEGVVLGGGAHERRAADVDVLDAGGEIAPRRHRLLEGIKVDGEEVDGTDAVGRHRRLVVGVAAHGEQAAVDERVQGLDPAVHDLRETGHLGDLGGLDAGVGKRFRRTSR